MMRKLVTFKPLQKILNSYSMNYQDALPSMAKPLPTWTLQDYLENPNPNSLYFSLTTAESEILEICKIFEKYSHTLVVLII